MIVPIVIDVAPETARAILDRLFHDPAPECTAGLP
jgi:hypothetical protein